MSTYRIKYHTLIDPLRDPEHAMRRLAQAEEEKARLRIQRDREMQGLSPIAIERPRNHTQAVVAGCVSLVLTAIGVVIGHEILRDNPGDPLPPPEIITRMAHVTRSRGVVPFDGTLCVLTIVRASGSDTCRAQITCESKLVFGAGRTGYEHCSLDQDAVVGLIDDSPTNVDGDPALHVDLRARTATLSDALFGGDYSASFTLEP